MKENKLIAEFMGLLHVDDDKYMDNLREMKSNGIFFEQGCMTSELKYDTDWNWLMAVVDKIEKLGATTRVKSNYNPFIKLNVHQVTIEIEKGELSEGNKSFLGDGFIYQNHSNSNLIKIEAYYESVVNFIKWYNDEQNSN
jgi:hypothetical protein